MKKAFISIALLALLMLSGCGQHAAPSRETANVPASGASLTAAPETERDAKTNLVFSVEGEEETVPATLYVGQEYSLYIPVDGWTKPEENTENDVLSVTWGCTDNRDVSLTVSQYKGQTASQVREDFMQSSGYTFEDTMDDGTGDPLIGTDAAGNQLAFVEITGSNATYVVSWRYPAEAAEGFGARLNAIAGSFLVN